MQYLLILSTKDPETVWNALRFGTATLGRNHSVNIFLLGAAVEIEAIRHEDFDVQGALERFAASGGEALSCGTCLTLRKLEPGALCPVSTMNDLVRLTEEADKVLTF